MKKIFMLIMAILLCTVTVQKVCALDGDDVDEYTPSQITIPFEKIWVGDTEEDRPSEITVALYRYKNGGSYTDDSNPLTATLTAQNNWKHDFIITDSRNDPAFYYDETDKKWYPYNFAVVEEEIENYQEIESAHVDPEIKMVTLDGEENWVWIRPNSVTKYPLVTSDYPKSFVAAKKGNQLYIWTPEVISPIEQEILLALVHSHPQFPHEDWEDTTFLTGYGHHAEGGFTMYEVDPQPDPGYEGYGAIKFDNHPAWSFWARGTYDRSVPEDHQSSITNALETDTTIDISVNKIWDDNNNQDGIRPESVTINVMNGENLVATIELDEEGDWTGTATGLPQYAGDEEIIYTITEKTDSVITGEDGPGTYSFLVQDFTVTNTHTPETTDITVTKEWKDEDDKDEIRPDSITIVLKADGEEADSKTITEEDQWTAIFSGLPVYKNGNKIDYQLEELSVEGYTTAISGSAADGYIITNTHEITPDPEPDPEPEPEPEPDPEPGPEPEPQPEPEPDPPFVFPHTGIDFVTRYVDPSIRKD